MSWKGRIIGTLIGFLFGGVGAIVGFAIGYFFFELLITFMHSSRVSSAALSCIALGSR